MQSGKFNIIFDQAWGSSGKGAVSTRLADFFNCVYTSSSNYPNAGHTVENDLGERFVAKALPTTCFLKKEKGFGIQAFVSPGSGFSWKQVYSEWLSCNKPNIFIHGRANIVTDEHKLRENQGPDSTKHVASTMQGTATAISDKILRKQDVLLASSHSIESVASEILGLSKYEADEFITKVEILDAMTFRDRVHGIIGNGHTWLHEGSQGYALSIDHGSHYPSCTSRNCTVQSYMDHMAIPPSMVGDVYMNLRTFPIRVGNVVEDGKTLGYSGDFYPDQKELTWEEVAKISGMPEEERKILAERERTTVTKRIRRVSDFSWIGLKDAVRVNGPTKICVNFIQYLNWKDAGLKGGKEAFEKLSKESREFISKVEEISQISVVMIGTGAKHSENICLL